MSNYEYHQRYKELQNILADNPEHMDCCTQWEGGECNCDPDVSTEDVPLPSTVT